MFASIWQKYLGPPLLYSPYHWAELSVIGVTVLSFALLCVLTRRGALSICGYVMVSVLPLFCGLLLSVGISISVLWQLYYSFVISIGPPETDFILYALLCSIIGFACTLLLVVTFGVVLIIRKTRTRGAIVTRTA